MRRLFLITCLLFSLIVTFSETPVAQANTITVNASCTLIDAIIAANTDTPSGGCPAGSGPDTIVIDLKQQLSVAYPGSTNIGGGQAGTPDITTDITIQAGLASHIFGVSANFRIFNVMSGGSLTLDGVIIHDGKIVGTPDAMGGGIYVDVGGTLALDGVTLQDNEAVGLAATDPGDAFGGGIYNDGTISSIFETSIQNNLALGGDSGGFGGTAEGGGVHSTGTITGIESTTIINNTAQGGTGTVTDGYGGYAFGVGLHNSGQISNMSNVYIALNVATSGPKWAFAVHGGGMFNSGAIDSMTGIDFTFNEAHGSPCFPLGASCGGGWVFGGGFYTEGSIVTIQGLTATNNLVTGSVDGAVLWGGGMHNHGDITLLEDCQFDHNILRSGTSSTGSAISLGGGGFVNSGGIDTLRDCSFSFNTLQITPSSSIFIADGAGFLHYGAISSQMNDVSVIGNNVTSVGPAGPPTGALFINGGGVAFYSDNGTLTNAVISDNVVDGRFAVDAAGGAFGLYIEGVGHAISNVTVSNNELLHNESFFNMAAIHGDASTFSHITAINNVLDNGTVQNSFDISSVENVFGSLIGNVYECNSNASDRNNLITNPAIVADCPTVFNGTFTIGTDVDAILQDNGGGTLTHALINHGGNPAIDGNPGCGLATDQRGFARDANCDIGAYEAGMLQNAMLTASATCNGPDLDVTISSGDALFNITATAGQNTPVIGVGLGTTTITGPEKWDDVTVAETSGDSESVNLGQFKCRTDERPVPISPAHRSHTTDTTPTFSWTGITDANNYRVFIFDDASAATRTVDIRQNSGGPTSLTLTTPLPTMRLFWRVRGRQNRVWSLWSIRFTLFVDPVVLVPINSDSTPIPNTEPNPTAQPTIIVPPNDRATPTQPAPPNSR